MVKLPEDQFSVKYYIARLLLIIPYIKKNYKFLIIGGVVGLAIGFTVEYFKFKERKYTAEIYFTIENQGSNESVGGLSSLLGISGSNESSNLFSNGNFEEFVKLPIVYKKALLTPIKQFGINDLFINHLIKHYSDHKDLENIKGYELFKRNVNFDSLTEAQNSVLNFTANYLMKKTTFKKESELSSFRKVTVISIGDTLSNLWASTILNTLTDIYIKNKTKKSSNLVKLLDRRVDSLRNALYYTQGKLASFADQNQQIIFQSAKITADRLQMNSTQLQALYNEAIRNYDSYKFSLEKETPLVNIVSKTDLPVFMPPYRWGFLSIFGFFIGVGVTVVLIFVISVYKEFFNE